MAGHFEIETRPDGQFTFSLKIGSASVLTGEAYTSKAACVNGIESVKKNASDEGRYRLTEAPDGRLRFALDAANGQAIAGSNHFDSVEARDTAIDFVTKNAPDAEVRDLS